MRLSLIAMLAALAALLAGCNGDDATPTAAPRRSATAAATSTASASSTVTASGSETSTAPPTATASATSTATASPAPTATEPVDTSNGSCMVTISGDDNVEFTGGGGPAAVGTDYWYSDDEIREVLREIAGYGGDKTDEEIEREVDEGMKRDPRYLLLVLNCVDSSGLTRLHFLPGTGSTYADVPFEPRMYVIESGGGLLGEAETPGAFGVLMTFGDGAYRVSREGVLDITRFDRSGISGSFSFAAEEVYPAGEQPAKVLTVEGSFDFACVGQSGCGE